MTRLEHVPDGLEEIVAYYGHPDGDGDGDTDATWWSANMELFHLPFPLRTSWRNSRGHVVDVRRQYIHHLVGRAMIDALAEIGERVAPAALRLCNCDRFGGLFAMRTSRRSDRLSTHAWGIAIDLNPHLGPLGGPNNQPEFITEAFVRRGFVHLGEADGMHYQAAAGY